MSRSRVVPVLAFACLCAWLATRAFAHPASGIVVDAKGNVFFIHTGRGVAKIDTKGKLTYVHKVEGGGHWLALDPQGKFSKQLPRLFEKVKLDDAKPALLYASGGAPFVVNRD